MALTMPIVMYHYVRDFSRTRFPQIKGLDIKQFKAQIKFLMKNYTVVSHDQVCAHIFESEALPKNSVMLTFDDGFADHFQYVFPVLDELKISGVFFPTVQAVLEHRVLDVHKIHFILASTEDHAQLLEICLNWVKQETSLNPDEIKAEYYFPNRYDGPVVNCLKHLLQKCIPLEKRQSLVAQLFERYVTRDERAFAEELYLSVDQLKCMLRNGMSIGNHGSSHCWMDTLGRDEQEKELQESLNLLELIGVDRSNWSIAYPYGMHNASLRELVAKYGGKLGFTTVPEQALLTKDNVLTLARLDTNDFPKD